MWKTKNNKCKIIWNKPFLHFYYLATATILCHNPKSEYFFSFFLGGVTLFLLLTLLQMSPFSLPWSTSTQPPVTSFLWPSSHSYLCLWVMHIQSLANPFTSVHPVPPTHLSSYSCQSVPCFCVSDSIAWLISLSLIVSSSTHAVEKGKNPFFFTAA